MTKDEFNTLLKSYFDLGFRVPGVLLKVPAEYKRLLSSEMQTWLREKHKIIVSAEPARESYEQVQDSPNERPYGKGLNEDILIYDVTVYNLYIYYQQKLEVYAGFYNSYEEALEVGLQEALKLI